MMVQEDLLLNDLTPPNYTDSPETDDEKDDTTQPPSRTVLGYFMLITSVLAGTGSGACTQILNRSIPHSELNGFRFFSQALLVTPLLIGCQKFDVRINKNLIGWMVMLSVSILITSYGHYGMFYYLPLGVASCMEHSLTVMTSYVINTVVKRRFRWYELVAAILCITGLLLITQPPVIFPHTDASILDAHVDNQTFLPDCGQENVSYTEMSTNANGTDISVSGIPSLHNQVLGYILCVIASLGTTGCLHIIQYRLLPVNIYVMNFWAALFGTISSFLIMAASETPYFPQSSTCVTVLLFHAILAGITTICAFAGIKLVSPFIASLVFATEIATTFILQYTLLYSVQPGHANSLEFSGIALVLVGYTFVPLYNIIKSRIASRSQENNT